MGLLSQNLTQQALFTCKRRLRQPTYHELFSFASSGAAFVGDVVCNCFDVVPIMRTCFGVSLMLVFLTISVSVATKCDHPNQVVLSNADIVTDETISRAATIKTGFVAVLTCTGGTRYGRRNRLSAILQHCQYASQHSPVTCRYHDDRSRDMTPSQKHRQATLERLFRAYTGVRTGTWCCWIS